MSSQAVSVEEFYTGIARYMDTVDPDWAEEGWQAQIARERETLRRVLGEARGRSALDCSCGGGGQAIPLAQLGWRVTATDVTDDALETARCRARRQGRVAAMLTGLSNASYPPFLTSSRGSAATEGSPGGAGPRSGQCAFRVTIRRRRMRFARRFIAAL